MEKAGAPNLHRSKKGRTIPYKAYERFEGLVDFLQYHKRGKITPARQSGSVPRITATEVRLEDGKLRLIILYFNPHDYDEYLRVIRLEYGELKIQKDRCEGAGSAQCLPGNFFQHSAELLL